MKEKIVNLEDLENMMIETKISLSSFIHRMVRQKEITEELFQDTWLKVVQNLDAYDRGKPFKPWLFRIARNLCINHLNQVKRRKKKNRLFMTSGREELHHSPQNETAQDEEKLKICLDRIPQKFREVLHLRFFEEMAFEDISTVLNVAVGTVYSRTNRGLKHLRKRWEKENEA
jgi:RNA polymerase sigma-70 factor (ECF subfamily)